MSKDEWRHTHTGEGGEELYQSKENKYYTKFAWDHFLAAYTGKVRPAHRDRPEFGPRIFPPDTSGHYRQDFHGGLSHSGIDFFSDGSDLWPADGEKTDPMPTIQVAPAVKRK